MSAASPVWVQVETNGKTYFWNPADDTTTWNCPDCVDVQWQAAQTGEQCWYYWNRITFQVTWDPPGSRLFDAEKVSSAEGSGLWQLSVVYRGPSVPLDLAEQNRQDHDGGCHEDVELAPFRHWFQNGAAMAISTNCSSSSEKYRGQIGIVREVERHMVTLELPAQLGQAQVRLPARDLVPLPSGTIVQLTSKDGLAEEVGTIVQDDGSSSSEEIRMVGAMEPEYIVKLVDETLRTVGVTEVVPRCPVWNLDLHQSSGWLQWRKEQTCLFVASTGEHHEFTIHLPLNFDAWLKLPFEERTPWPMLVYLHGTGGSGFFSTSKKALKSHGITYAAGKFVIVSPKCTWTWKDTPLPWVGELVTTLRSADFVDHQRIYLSGCSMGGMGVWEIGSRTPELYAAVAPVAAHHKAERAEHIAKQLGDMPIFICQSRADSTCPMRLEYPLWKAIRKTNRRMQINLCESVDHCSVFEKVYCDDTVLYDWFLMHRRDMRP